MQKNELKKSIYQMMDNEELEEFKYEFNLKYLNLIPMCPAYFDNLIKGYIFLHQLLRDDIVYLTNKELIWEFKESLEDGESFTYKNNKFRQ